MDKILKRTLTQHIQHMDHDLMCLELSFQQITEFQMNNFEILSIGVDKLRNTVELLPISNIPICSMVRHDIYNQLTVIGGFAQIMMHKAAGHIEIDTIGYLNKIIETSRCIAAALQADKAANVVRF